MGKRCAAGKNVYSDDRREVTMEFAYRFALL